MWTSPCGGSRWARSRFCLTNTFLIVQRWVCLCVSLSIFLSFSLSVTSWRRSYSPNVGSMFDCLSLCLFVYLTSCLSVFLSFRMYVPVVQRWVFKILWLSVSFIIYLSIFRSLSLSLCLSISLYNFLLFVGRLQHLPGHHETTRRRIHLQSKLSRPRRNVYRFPQSSWTNNVCRYAVHRSGKKLGCLLLILIVLIRSKTGYLRYVYCFSQSTW
jgi:hypothetical protein